MTQGNGSLRNVDAGGETMRLIMNAMMHERGLGQHAISRERWEQWRPHPNLVEAIRNMPRRKKGEDE